MSRLTAVLFAMAQALESKLRDREFVANLVRECGIEAHCHMGDVETKHRCHGGMLQVPDQLAPFLVDAADWGVRTYLEVGTWSGRCAAFVAAYLARFGLQSALTIDPTPKLLEEWNKITGTLPLRHLPFTSAQLAGRKFDLVFVDGCHDYPAVEKDWLNVGRYAKRCAFHDVQERWVVENCQDGGVPAFWAELPGRKTQYLEHPLNLPVMGIGVVENT